MKKILFLCAIILGFQVTEASDCVSAYNEGNQAYLHADYASAVRSYSQCLESGVQSVDVYYNMGNAYFRLDSLGKAILYYEKAMRLDPGNADVRRNLEFAQTRKVDKVSGELEENPVLQALFSLHHALSLKTQLLILFALSWLLAALLLGLLLVHRAGFKPLAYGLIAGILVLGGSGALSAGYKIWVWETQQVGVVLVRAADVYSGPGKQYQVLNELHEGTRFEVLDVRENWVSIRVDDRVGGFVRQDQVGLVK